LTDSSLISVARREFPADLILTNARIVNVFTGEIEPGNVAVSLGEKLPSPFSTLGLVGVIKFRLINQ